MSAVLDLPIEATRVLAPVYVVVVLLAVALVAPTPGVLARRSVWWPAAALAAGLGAIAGSLAVWVVVDGSNIKLWGGKARDFNNATHINRRNMRRLLRYVVAHSDGALKIR